MSAFSLLSEAWHALRVVLEPSARKAFGSWVQRWMRASLLDSRDRVSARHLVSGSGSCPTSGLSNDFRIEGIAPRNRKIADWSAASEDTGIHFPEVVITCNH